MDISENKERKVIKLRKYSKKPQNEEINEFPQDPPPVLGNVRSLRGRQIPTTQTKKRKRRKNRNAAVRARETQSLTRSLTNLQLEQNPPPQLQQNETTPFQSNLAQNQAQPPKTTQTVTQADQTPPQRRNLIKIDQLYIDPKQVSSYSTDLQRYLREKETLSRHRKIIKKFNRRRTIVNGPFTQIQSDTM